MPPPLRSVPSPLRSTLHHSQDHARIRPPHSHPIQYRHRYRNQHTTTQQHATSDVPRFSLIPRILRKSTWDMVIPKFLRRPRPSTSPSSTSPTPTKKRNPATYFIWIYLLIGSQAIRIIAVQSEFQTFTRRADLRLDILREVVRKLQAGEEVDVEKALGTGVESEEKEWEEAMAEIAEEEDKWVLARRKMREREEARRKEEEVREREEEERRLDASPVARGQESKIVSAVGFY